MLQSDIPRRGQVRSFLGNLAPCDPSELAPRLLPHWESKTLTLPVSYQNHMPPCHTFHLTVRPEVTSSTLLTTVLGACFKKKHQHKCFRTSPFFWALIIAWSFCSSKALAGICKIHQHTCEGQAQSTHTHNWNEQKPSLLDHFLRACENLVWNHKAQTIKLTGHPTFRAILDNRSQSNQATNSDN